MADQWHYSGDVNIEHGGMFYSLREFDNGYVECVRVTPCACADGPDNCFWVEQLTVTIESGWEHALAAVGETREQRYAHLVLHDLPYPINIESAFSCCGVERGDYLALNATERKHAIVESLVGYGWAHTVGTTIVQVGKRCRPNADFPEPGVVLRANASLRKYVRSQCEG